jgi:hypothetical protein
MKGGRKWNEPEISSDFVTSWWGWWRALKADVQQLDVAGPNGVLLLVLGLAWWAVHEKKGDIKDVGVGGWNTAVEEVTSMLTSLCAPAKATSVNSTADNSSKK